MFGLHLQGPLGTETVLGRGWPVLWSLGLEGAPRCVDIWTSVFYRP